MLIGLSLTLALLIFISCGDKGSKSIITSFGFGLLLIMYLKLISSGISPYVSTVIVVALQLALILFFQNERSLETYIAFSAVIITLIVLLPLAFYFTSSGAIEGFNPLEYEITDSNGYTRNVNLNMTAIEVSVLIIALIGATVDSSIATTSSILEIFSHCDNLSWSEGISIGKTVGGSILSTSIHTVFYIYVAEYLTLFIEYADSFSFSAVINSKAFAQGFLSMAIVSLGCSAVIPISAFLCLFYMRQNKRQS